MAYSKKQRPTSRVKFVTDPNYYADVYSSLRFKEQKALGLIDEQGNKGVVVAADVLLNAMIAAWNLDDEEGNPIPVSQEAINELEKPDADALLTEIGKIMDVVEQPKLEAREAHKKK
jgi:hypothetical protein